LAVKKKKLLELDIVRAFAILAVLMIHNTSEATVELTAGSTSQILYLAMNKLSNFAVPVFIFISGLVLFYRYYDDWSGKQAFAFYLKRVKQVLFPYLIWSFFYYAYNQLVFEPDKFHINVSAFLDLLPWADASYHLYFMIIIVQFYLLFPVLLWLCRASAFVRSYLFLIGVAIQAGAYMYSRLVEPIPNTPSLGITYFSLFALGGYLGMNYDRFTAWIDKHIGWVMPASVALGCSFMGLFVLKETRGIMFNNLWYEIIFNAYPMMAGMSFIWIGRLLLKRGPALSKILLSLGAVSYGIYLMHPAVLSYWRTRFIPESGNLSEYILYTVIAFVLSLGIPWLLAYAYGQAMRRLRPAPKKKLSNGAA